MAPRLWLVAGPNGSGKSTLVASRAFDALDTTPEARGGLIYINPDEIAFSLRAKSRKDIALTAARKADALVRECIAEKRSFLRETVLSTDRLLKDLAEAKAAGFRLLLVYVVLQTPGLNVARVAARVRLGGHDVPEQKIRDRWARSLGMLPRFVELADVFGAWDNSYVDEAPRLLITKTDADWYVSAHTHALTKARSTLAPLRSALQGLIAMAGEGNGT
jgi:predicted ABC-type ATPase